MLVARVATQVYNKTVRRDVTLSSSELSRRSRTRNHIDGPMKFGIEIDLRPPSSLIARDPSTPGFWSSRSTCLMLSIRIFVKSPHRRKLISYAYTASLLGVIPTRDIARCMVPGSWRRPETPPQMQSHVDLARIVLFSATERSG